MWISDILHVMLALLTCQFSGKEHLGDKLHVMLT